MAGPSDYDRKHVEEILGDNPPPQYFNWFSAYLIRLVAKADPSNRARIRVAFPEHVEAYEDWYYQRGSYAPVVEVPS